MVTFGEAKLILSAAVRIEYWPLGDYPTYTWRNDGHDVAWGHKFDNYDEKGENLIPVYSIRVRGTMFDGSEAAVLAELGVSIVVNHQTKDDYKAEIEAADEARERRESSYVDDLERAAGESVE